MGKQQKQAKRWCPQCQTLSRAYEGAGKTCKSCGNSTMAPPTGAGMDYQRLTGKDPRQQLKPSGRGQRPL